MKLWYSWLSAACLVVGVACAASAFYLNEVGLAPWGAVWHASMFTLLGTAIRAYRPR